MRPSSSRVRRKACGWTCLIGVVALASCAPLPPPTPPPVPPASRPGRAETPPVPSPAVPTPVEAGEPEITVGLATDLDSLVIDPVGAAEATLGEKRALERDARLYIRLEGSRARVRSLDSRDDWERALSPGDTLWLAGTGGPEGGPARLIRWNGKSWRGRFKVFLNPRGKLTVADQLPLESYLLGVVPAEIGALADELLEAGRAQAVAARSYTLFYRGRRAAEGFDLYGTVEDQVYGPVESERPLATRCVETTAGQVARSQGQPIRANYCSTCGGITADVWEAWPTPPLPYLVSHLDRRGATDYCAGSPHHRWSEEWSVAELTSNLARFAPQQGVPLPDGGVGELVDVRVASRSRSGRVWNLTVTTTTGTVNVPAYSIRQVLRRPGNPAAILRSNLFKIDVRRDPATRRALAVVASGAGSGHGVGLCQTGALGMARAGSRAADILSHYYPGAQIKREY